MGNDGTYKHIGRTKSNMPIFPPVDYNAEMRYSEVDVSLYSEFSDDEDDTTHDKDSRQDEFLEKEMFSK